MEEIWQEQDNEVISISLTVAIFYRCPLGKGDKQVRLLQHRYWHLGRTLEGRSRMEKQAQFLDELTAIVEEEKVDVGLVAGDVFDTVNPPAQAEQPFYDSMARLAEGKGRRPVVVIAGNHDHPTASPRPFLWLREQGSDFRLSHGPAPTTPCFCNG